MPRDNAPAPATANQVFTGPRHPLTAEIEQSRFPDPGDRYFHAMTAALSAGMSPASLYLAYADWALHSGAYPLRRLRLAVDAQNKLFTLQRYAWHKMWGLACADCIKADEQDDRFAGAGWQDPPFDIYAQSFLLVQDWWQNATAGLHGVSPHHEDVVRFTIRQWLDMMAPVNVPFMNPEVIRATLDNYGMNFVNGAINFTEDVSRFLTNRPPRGTEDFQLGEDLAATPGQVIYKNELIELIQYSPQTQAVYPEPVLIVPPWIMKYYILDLSPHNSLVSYLVAQGHTVFMISWRNPRDESRNLSLADYADQGVFAALEAVSAIVPKQKIHMAGYCIGGTLLAIVAARMARQEDQRLASMTLFTTQLDFEEAGELLLFVDESQLACLEDLMWMQGYLDKTQLSGTFNMLRSKDLIWSHMIQQYQLGNDNEMFDMQAWNVDSTRIPYKVHAEYLRSLYLNNDLAENRYVMKGETVFLQDIDVPVFAVATVKDHIAPWHSAYEIHRLLNTNIDFVLTSGGHNAGILSEPGHPHRYYKYHHHKAGQRFLPHDKWLDKAADKEGSWWPTWHGWLRKYSGEKQSPPSMGAADKGYKILCAAPGNYVLER